MAEIAEDEGEIAESDGSADAVAARHDEHAEGGGEHHLELDAGGLETDEVGEGAGGVGGKMLKGEVEESVEEVGDGVDEEQKAERGEGATEKLRAAEEEGGAGSVGEEGHAGVEDADALAEEEKQQHGGGEQAGGGDGGQEEREAPRGAVGGVAETAPGGEGAEEGEKREKGADGAEGVCRPEAPGGGPDR